MELTESYETLASGDTMEMVAVIGGSYAVGTLMKNTIEGRTDLDLPDEAYGLATVGAGGYLLDGDRAKYAVIGGGLYAGDALAERVGIKSRLQNAGSGGN